MPKQQQLLVPGLVECNHNWGLLAPVEHACAQVDAAACVLPSPAPGCATSASHDAGLFCVGRFPRAPSWLAAAHGQGLGLWGRHGAGAARLKLPRCLAIKQTCLQAMHAGCCREHLAIKAESRKRHGYVCGA